MDAITLSTAQMVQDGPGNGGITVSQGGKLIVLASMSNLLFKCGIAALMGHRGLAYRVALLFAVPFVVGACWLVL